MLVIAPVIVAAPVSVVTIVVPVVPVAAAVISIVVPVVPTAALRSAVVVGIVIGLGPNRGSPRGLWCGGRTGCARGRGRWGAGLLRLPGA
ncbi:MAG: hypothetical protein WBP28_06065, partial [Nostocoides sp.]